MKRKILIVRMGAMGDIVHTLPSAATLRRAFPDAEIDWLVEAHWAPLLEDNPHLSGVLKLTKRDFPALLRMIGELRDNSYDTVIDFQGLMKSAAIAGLAGATNVIGFRMETLREKLAAAAYDRWIAVPEASHVVEQNLVLAHAAGAPEDVLEFPLPEGTAPAAADFVAMSPSAGWEAKRWPPEKFAELAARVKLELGWHTLVNAGPGEGALAAGIAGEKNVVSGGIGTLIGMARKARVFVAGDTGPLHVAAAVGTPVVAIFGPTSPERNGPYTSRARVVRAEGVETTYSRSAGGEDIARVPVEEVFRALVDVVGGTSRRHGVSA